MRFGMPAVLLILLGLFFWMGNGLRADYTKKLQQQVTINTAGYSVGSTGFVPTDNSLGLVYYHGDVYTGQSVYFEAVIRCAGCSGGNAQAQAALYTDGGTVVSGSTVSTTNSDFVRVRSGDITANLTNGEEYTVRVNLDATDGTAYLQVARLVINQDSANILRTQTQVELGNTANVSNATYQLIPGVKIFGWAEADYSHVEGVYFEAVIHTDDALATAYAALSSSPTCETRVTGSELTTSSTSYVRLRSGNLASNLDDDTDYWVCVRSTVNDTTSIVNGKLIIQQYADSGIKTTTLYHQYQNRVETHNADNFLLLDYPVFFDPGVFEADFIDYYFESTIRTSGGTGYARLYNLDDTANIGGSTVETTSAGYSRQRSGVVTGLPTVAKELDVQIRNSSTDITTSSNSWMIISLDRPLDPELTFEVRGVNTSTTINGITTSANSEYSTLPFGNLGVNSPRYVAHELYVESNAPGGYSVTAVLQNYLQGNYPGNNIDPFLAPWSAPTTWTNPTGTTPNEDTGWFGAHTSDNRVTGWSDANAKFAGVSNTPVTVMYSAGADAGTSVNVVYVVGVNHFQPADLYSGMVVYSLVPAY